MKKFKFTFKTLYSNQVILDERKSNPWWLALIFLVLSLVCTVVPTMVNGFKTNGSKILTGTNNELERGLVLFLEEKPNMQVDDKGIIIYDPSTITPSSQENPEPMKVNDKVMTFTQDIISGTETQKEETITLVNVYFFPELDPANNSKDNETLNDIINEYLYKKDPSDTSKFLNVPTSSLIITKSSIKVYLFKALNATVSTTSSAVLEGVLTGVKGTDFKTAAGSSYDTAKNFWYTFLDEAYRPIKVSQTWISTGVLCGINAVVILMIGVLIFAFTRGKMSSYRDMNFFEGLKSGAYISLSPALISLVLSFLIPSMGTMMFLMIAGLRAMFLIMKAGPSASNNNSNKPVYQARS